MKKALFSILCIALLGACTHHNTEFSNPQTYADNTHDWYLDFWSTSCGPCIAGIKDCFKYRRELITGQYDQFALVFITSDSERAYEPFRKEWLDGAQSYRISEDDWNALAGLFNFSAIPHHEMITPDGRAVTKVPEMFEVNPDNPDPNQK